MITIKIDEETNSVVGMSESLRRIADLLEQGYTSGYEPSWSISGQEEDPTAEEEEDPTAEEEEWSVSLAGSGDLVKDGFSSEQTAYDWLRIQLASEGEREGDSIADYVVEKSNEDKE